MAHQPRDRPVFVLQTGLSWKDRMLSKRFTVVQKEGLRGYDVMINCASPKGDYPQIVDHYTYKATAIEAARREKINGMKEWLLPWMTPIREGNLWRAEPTRWTWLDGDWLDLVQLSVKLGWYKERARVNDRSD